MAGEVGKYAKAFKRAEIIDATEPEIYPGGMDITDLKKIWN